MKDPLPAATIIAPHVLKVPFCVNFFWIGGDVMPPRVKISGEYSYQSGEKRSYANTIKGIAGFLFVMAGTSIVTTQYMAKTMQYAPGLGPELFSFRGVPVYAPFRAYKWLALLISHGGFSKFSLSCIAFLGIGLFFAVAILIVGFCTESKGTLSNVHGSARWAKKEDIIEAGLLPRDGTVPTEVSVYVGGWAEQTRHGLFFHKERLRYLIHGGPEHILAFAPTRSGKGVGLVIPTPLRWAGSVLVYDIKGENYALTAGWRKEELDSAVIRLDPTDPAAFDKRTSGTFNPLEEIPLDYALEGRRKIGERPPLVQTGSGETAAIQNLVSIIVDPEGKGLDDHWSKTSHSLLVGCITHLLYAGFWEGKRPCLADIAAELSKPGVNDPREIYKSWQMYPHLGERDGEPIVHNVVNASAQEAINRDPKEGSSVLSTAISYLTLYRDPVIAKNTSRSSFKIADLMRGDKPVSLYFVVKPADKDRIRPFVRLFITQVIRRLADSMEFKDGEQVKGYEHRLLLMLDEFPSLGWLKIFEEALAFIAGYGMKAYLIIQDIAQLHQIYGKDEAITGNCHVKIAYATSNPDTARYLSEQSGTTTIVKEADSISGERASLFKKSVSTSVQEISRPLLTVDECMRLRGPEKDSEGMILVPGDMLIFVAGYAGIYGRQMLFFKDRELSSRAKINAPGQSDSTYSPNAEAEILAVRAERMYARGGIGGCDPDSPSMEDLAWLDEMGVLLGIIEEMEPLPAPPMEEETPSAEDEDGDEDIWEEDGDDESPKTIADIRRELARQAAAAKTC
jgi:type IV secretion system protein VirD4